ncbi:MAG: MopE-related protein [Bacteroidota bacterium]
MRLRYLPTLLLLMLGNGLCAQHSVARLWNEAALAAIRADYARPTVHARNLFHLAVAMYDAWAVYEEEARPYLLGNDLVVYNCPFEEMTNWPTDRQAAQEIAISYAAFRFLSFRFVNSPGAESSLQSFENLFDSLGHDPAYTSLEYSNGQPAAMGNYIAYCLMNYGHYDGANEQNDYANTHYLPTNPPLVFYATGNPDLIDYNRWQPLAFESFIDQSGHHLPLSTPPFLSPEWGGVSPFALQETDLQIYQRDSSAYWVYHDPGPPPYLDTSAVGGLSEAYKWGNALVAVWSGHLDASDSTLIDISPASIGNLSEYPSTMEELPNFYNLLAGGDNSPGHTLNPHTGMPYAPQLVKRADYARVLAEFWADGPDSETPPGHWFTILNYVSDHPSFEKRIRGQAEVLTDLAWDVKAYLALGGAVHDAAIAAWGIKGWYDYIRPISAIRAMAALGQSSDSSQLSYHAGGIHLIPDAIELVQSDDALALLDPQNIGKIKLFAWRGPDHIDNPSTDEAGVSWILAEHWLPYQRPTFVTPPFAGYVSGHSTFSRAAAEVLSQLTGDDFFPGGMGAFNVTRNDFLVFEQGPSQDLTLQWATYQDAADQCSLSRIWGGIHPPADDIPGRIIGSIIGHDAFAKAETYFYQDLDQDGVLSYLDCDDSNPTIYPGALEISDGFDNDCNGLIDDGVSSVADPEKALFRIYPNPVKEELFWQSEAEEPLFYQLSNATGQLLSSGYFSPGAGHLRLNGLPAGFYLLSWMDQSTKQIGRLRVLKQ